VTTYRLAPAGTAPVAAPELDAHQRAVVDHPGGPLLVLAGPGTGKTTTLVEAIVDRIEQRGASPESVLALTFSRKAAEQLRDRVTARLGRTMATTLSSTFHSYAYGLVRRFSAADLYCFMLTRWGRNLPRKAWTLPSLGAHYRRLAERPSVAVMLEKQGIEAVPA